MSRPTLFACAYLALAFLWQFTLWNALPNVGMGGLAILFLVWPTLAFSTIGLWFLLKQSEAHQAANFVLASALMLVVTLAVHPQDSQTSVGGKMKRLSQYIVGS